MASYYRSDERKKITHDFRRREEEVVTSLCRLGSLPTSPKSLVEEEKRIRREIANSNERRRMQSINAGFQSLRTLLPLREGEKLSKAAILQNTADYIYQLEHEKTHLLEQYCQLKRSVLNSHNNQDSDSSCSDSPLPKRKKGDTADTKNEGIRSLSPFRSENSGDDDKPELNELKHALEQERNLRIILEKQISILESQLISTGNIPKINNQYPPQCQSVTEDSLKPLTSVVTMTVDNTAPSSPKSQIHNHESSSSEGHILESTSEISSEVPKDLSTKNSSVLLPCVSELSLSDVAASPDIHFSADSLNTASSFQAQEHDSTPRQVEYKANTCRQNLETIVEAIRLVESGHMFLNDPSPSESDMINWADQKEIKLEEQCKKRVQQTVGAHLNPDISQHHQVIRIASVVQDRPGVIVSNHS